MKMVIQLQICHQKLTIYFLLGIQQNQKLSQNREVIKEIIPLLLQKITYLIFKFNLSKIKFFNIY
ncbi:unnamed protein product [Paramecium sonneborni]|uniref:Uncharacterized protein n=1 Tax=Paramecium sonneborni TaxID=65129 RepID=A0A8S1MC24_9CILI|nr:unnamed protein product [Paramecium sonneborni]